MLNRREMMAGAAAAALGGWARASAGGGTRAAAGGGTRAADGGWQYENAVVIDALGGVGEIDPAAADDAPLTPRALADARESGVTVLNLTVNEVGNGPNKFMNSVKNIANAEHELRVHPDYLLKILRGGDIKAAKATKRVGLIYGCQDTTMLEGDLTRL